MPVFQKLLAVFCLMVAKRELRSKLSEGLIYHKTPLGINSNCDHNYYKAKDIGFMVFINIFTVTIMFYRDLLRDPENFIEANPLITSSHIQPEWYFL